MALEAARNVRRLRPLRVLLASRDRRFMRVTSFLLERRGYDVVQVGGSNLVEAAVRTRADVVVLEAQASRAWSARAVATLAALPVPPGVVTIIEDGSGIELPGTTALAKWSAIDVLAREIDSASLRRDIPHPQQTLQP
jgi:CheY-like chemotaxis protein